MGKNSFAGRKIKRTLSGWTQDQRDGPSSNVTVVWGEPMDSVTIASVRRLTGVLVPLCRSIACEHAGLLVGEPGSRASWGPPTSSMGLLEMLWKHSFHIRGAWLLRNTPPLLQITKDRLYTSNHCHTLPRALQSSLWNSVLYQVHWV